MTGITRRETLALAGTAAVAGLMQICTARADTVEIKMLNRGAKGLMVFEPDLVKIKPGESVRFLSADKGHNAASWKSIIPEGAEPFNSKISQDYSVTFTVPGLYGIQCTPHLAAGMIAIVLVGDPVNLEAAKAVKVSGPQGKRLAEILSAL